METRLYLPVSVYSTPPQLVYDLVDELASTLPDIKNCEYYHHRSNHREGIDTSDNEEDTNLEPEILDRCIPSRRREKKNPKAFKIHGFWTRDGHVFVTNGRNQWLSSFGNLALLSKQKPRRLCLAKPRRSEHQWKRRQQH